MSDRNKTAATNQPYAVLGSGDLVSHLQRQDVDADSKTYRFNLFRIEHDHQVTHGLRPNDLRAIVKLCQVLAFTIADDGWIPDDVRRELFELAADLDLLTHQWRTANSGTTSNP